MKIFLSSHGANRCRRPAGLLTPRSVIFSASSSFITTFAEWWLVILFLLFFTNVWGEWGILHHLYYKLYAPMSRTLTKDDLWKRVIVFALGSALIEKGILMISPSRAGLAGLMYVVVGLALTGAAPFIRMRVRMPPHIRTNQDEGAILGACMVWPVVMCANMGRGIATGFNGAS